MALMVTMESEELDGMQTLIEELEKFGTVIAGVELNNIERTPYPFRPNAPKVSNTFILEDCFRDDQQRDFITLDSEQEARIGKAFETEAQKQIDRFAQQATKLDKDAIQRKIDQAASKAYIKAMHEYMTIVRENIESGRIEKNTLSESWSEIKEMWFGRTYPIGIASEQLVENLNVKGVGLRNVRLIKKSTLFGS